MQCEKGMEGTRKKKGNAPMVERMALEKEVGIDGLFEKEGLARLLIQRRECLSEMEGIFKPTPAPIRYLEGEQQFGSRQVFLVSWGTQFASKRRTLF